MMGMPQLKHWAIPSPTAAWSGWVRQQVLFMSAACHYILQNCISTREADALQLPTSAL